MSGLRTAFDIAVDVVVDIAIGDAHYAVERNKHNDKLLFVYRQMLRHLHRHAAQFRQRT